MSYFEKKLLDLLPPIYRERDTNGDLSAFLSVPGSAFDEIKELIDAFPNIFNIDSCDAGFVPMLAELVGYDFDTKIDVDVQRMEIREIVESYRRKGSIPTIKRSLSDTGWEGKLDETFHSALRLNKRSIVNNSKLPGDVYSLGVYRIESENIISGIRTALESHHPAGMKAFFLQWLKTIESMGDSNATLAKIIEMVMMGHLHETFIVKHNKLNSDYKLTYKEKAWGIWHLQCSSTLSSDIERAGSLVMRWMAPGNSFKLNTASLNSESLANLWISEAKAAFTCETDIGSGSTSTTIRTCKEHLNASRFPCAESGIHILFRQIDIYAFAQAGFTSAANLYTVLQWPTD